MFRARPVAMAAALASVALLATACGSGGGPEDDGGGPWKPDRPIEIIAPAATGGGWDTLARTSGRVLEQGGLVDEPVQVVNKPGGGGSIGWAYVARTPDTPTRLFVTSPPISLVPLMGGSVYDHEDFTPIARLATESMVYLVPDGSPIGSWGEMVELLKEDPRQVSIAGGSSPGSMDHVGLAGAVNAAGIDPTSINYVPFDGGGEAMTQAVGGHVDAVVTGASEAAGLVESGDLRPLAVSGAERAPTLPDTPTLHEEGVDFTFDIWRGVMGPPDMTDEQVAYYEDLFSDMTEEESWKKQTEGLGWTDSYMGSEEFGDFLDASSRDSADILAEIGLIEDGEGR